MFVKTMFPLARTVQRVCAGRVNYSKSSSCNDWNGSECWVVSTNLARPFVYRESIFSSAETAGHAAEPV